MFGSRQTRGGFVSVRLHPVKLLIIGLAMVLVGVVAMGDGSDVFWAIPIGILVTLMGCRLVYIGSRQIIRGLRTFFS
jgi:hypothetical protein